VGEDQPRPGSKGDGLPPAGGAHAVSRGPAFHLVGYGLHTCIGNSGPCLRPFDRGRGRDWWCARYSRGTQLRGTDQQEVRANYLASPPLALRNALAGRIDLDCNRRPGTGQGRETRLSPRHLASAGVDDLVRSSIKSAMFHIAVRRGLTGTSAGAGFRSPRADRSAWSRLRRTSAGPYSTAMPGRRRRSTTSAGAGAVPSGRQHHYHHISPVGLDSARRAPPAST